MNLLQECFLHAAFMKKFAHSNSTSYTIVDESVPIDQAKVSGKTVQISH